MRNLVTKYLKTIPCPCTYRVIHFQYTCLTSRKHSPSQIAICSLNYQNLHLSSPFFTVKHPTPNHSHSFIESEKAAGKQTTAQLQPCNSYISHILLQQEEAIQPIESVGPSIYPNYFHVIGFLSHMSINLSFIFLPSTSRRANLQ